MNIRSISVSAFVVLASAYAGPREATAQNLDADAIEIGLAGRFQMQAASSSCSHFSTAAPRANSLCASDVPGLDLFVRRARFTLDAQFNDWISGRFQPDFAALGDVMLLDAWGKLNLQPGASQPHAEITIGHFKRPFDGFQLTSSTQMLTIERDLDIPGVSGTTALSLDELTTRNRLSDRDVGVMVDGGTPDDRFHYWVAVFNGNGVTDNGDFNTDKQLVARGQVKLAAGDYPLKLAGAVAVTDIPFTNADSELDAKRFSAFELFGELGDFGGGLHLQAGVVFGSNGLQNEAGGTPDLIADDPLADMFTWQAIGSYKLDVDGGYFFEAIEPLFRISMADPNTEIEDDQVVGFTPGVQVFFAGRNKLALNWDFVAFGPDGVDGENSFKAQYQFHF